MRAEDALSEWELEALDAPVKAQLAHPLGWGRVVQPVILCKDCLRFRNLQGVLKRYSVGTVGRHEGTVERAAARHAVRYKLDKFLLARESTEGTADRWALSVLHVPVLGGWPPAWIIILEVCSHISKLS